MRWIPTLWFGQLKRRLSQLVVVFVVSMLVSLLSHLPNGAQNYLYYKWQEAGRRVDLIIGYKGSPLQIIASTLYRLEAPTGNVSEETLNYWKRHPMVAEHAEVALGDNWQGHPIVGVSENYFKWMNLALVEGRWPERSSELVVPRALAMELGLSIGDEVFSQHGADARGEAHHHHGLRISGVFEAERPVDNAAFFVPIAAYHELHHSENKEVTSILLKLKSKSALVILPNVIRQRADEQGAFPAFVFAQLQKQWQPLLDRAQAWSVWLVLGLSVVFAGFMQGLFSNERNARAVLRVQHVPTLTAVVALYGLSFVFAALGMWSGHLISTLVPGYRFEASVVLWALVPLALSFLLLVMNEIRQR